MYNLRRENFDLVLNHFHASDYIHIYIYIYIYIYILQTKSTIKKLTLDYCLFGSVKLTKNTDPVKCKCSSYGVGFHSRLKFSLPDGSMGKNVIIFGAEMSLPVHIDNKGKDILILGEVPT